MDWVQGFEIQETQVHTFERQEIAWVLTFLGLEMGRVLYFERQQLGENLIFLLY